MKRQKKQKSDKRVVMVRIVAIVCAAVMLGSVLFTAFAYR